MEGEALHPGGFALKLGQHRRCCFYELFGVDRFSGEAPEAPGIVNPLLFSYLSYLTTSHHTSSLLLHTAKPSDWWVEGVVSAGVCKCLLHCRPLAAVDVI